ncbi:MAG: energy-coupling factor transporter transmembrane protein EcfT [Ruminococcaceae bacterium]|nr:energy-coupling factor transporter transmembrane protein EcfT [Oscillospiraceae bacterium]
MLKDITLGQYFSGDSFLHNLDPRIKIILVVIYAVTVFLAKNLFSLLFLLLTALILTAISGISFKVVLKSIKPVMILLVFTAVINIFLTSTDADPIFHWQFIKIYRQGIINAIFMVVRILSLITGTSVLLTYTTSPISLTDGLERLLSPLKKIKVPVHEFAMMMTIALRFIPTLLEETDKIISAQKARGAGFDSGGIVKKAKAFLPILIPLFISAFRRADELACAMECRCYRGDEGRTRMKVLKLRATDVVTLLLGIIFVIAVFFFNSIPTDLSI